MDEEAKDEKGRNEARTEETRLVSEVEFPEQSHHSKGKQREEEEEEEAGEEARKGRELLEKAVEREQVLRSISHTLERREKAFHRGRPVKAERSQQHQYLEVIKQNTQVNREHRATLRH